MHPDNDPVDQIVTEETGSKIELYRDRLESGGLRTTLVTPSAEIRLTDRDAAALARALLQASGY